MIIFSPISKFRVRYEVADGIPYSHLDHMVLKAISEEFTTHNRLVQLFQIHPRLILQSLVTLTKAGWVALGGTLEHQFVITIAGKAALKEEKLPDFIERKHKSFYVILDRVTGIVVPDSLVSYTTIRLLKERKYWNKKAYLKTEIYYNRIDEGEIIHMLPRNQGQRLHWVGPIEMVSRDEDVMLVDYDPKVEMILNLPRHLAEALEPYVFDKASEIATQITSEEYEWPQEETEKYVYGKPTMDNIYEEGIVNLKRETNVFLIGQLQHNLQLHKAINESKSLIMIASSFVSTIALAELKADLLNALKRGVDIHILRGWRSSQDSLDWIMNLNSESPKDEKCGRIIATQTTTPSNARILLWDSDDNIFNGILGSYDWLAEPSLDSGSEFGISVRIQHSLLISYLARVAAGIWASSRSERLSSVPDRWRRVSTNLEEAASKEPPCETADAIKVHLCTTRELSVLFRTWIRDATKRLIISSTLLDSSLIPVLHKIDAKTKEGAFNFQLIYQTLTKNSNDEANEGISKLKNASIQNLPELWGRLIVSDDHVCITSYNFLGTDAPNISNLREIGLIIEDNEIANFIEEHLKSCR